MRRVCLGRTGLEVSAIGLGASALGGVFEEVRDEDGMRTVHAALEAGITLFDVAPAYGATRSERVLGEALAGVSRESFVLSTKVGKTTDEGGRDHFDYSESGIRRSLDASLTRLGVDYVDLLHLHDFDYRSGMLEAQAFAEGFPTLRKLREEGRIRAVGAGIYAMDLWKRVVLEVDLDVVLLHNHHTLCDIRSIELLPLLEARGIGVINAAPFASGLLTGHNPPAWHPAPPEARRVFARAAAYAEHRGVPLARLALAFSCQEPRLPVTLFSCASPRVLRRNLEWSVQPVDRNLVAEVQRILEPVMNRQWPYGGERPEPSPAGDEGATLTSPPVRHHVEEASGGDNSTENANENNLEDVLWTKGAML